MSAALRGIDRKANLITFVLGGLVSSELMWIIRTENKKADFERKTQSELKISQNVVDRLKKGENVDVDKELLGHDSEDQPFDLVLKNIEETDDKWSESKNLRPAEKQSTDVNSGRWL